MGLPLRGDEFCHTVTPSFIFHQETIMNVHYRLLRAHTPAFWLLSIVVLFMLMPREAGAQLRVVPTYLFLNYPIRSVKMVVTNPNDSPVEAWIEFKYGYPLMNDTGRIMMYYADSTTVPVNDAGTWVKAFPQRFTLQGSASQVVQLAMYPPDGLADGEYWTRVFISEKPSRPITGRVGKAVTGAINVTSLDIPFHYRKGRLKAAIDVGEPIVTIDSTTMKVSTHVRNVAGTAYWGTVQYRLRDRRDIPLLTEDHKFVSYTDYTFTKKLNIRNILPGEYTLDIDFRPKRQDIRATELLASSPVNRRIKVVIP